MQAVAEVTSVGKRTSDPNSKELGEWIEAVSKAAITIEGNLMQVIADAYQKTEDWAKKCKKKPGNPDPKTVDPRPDLMVSVGSVYTKIDPQTSQEVSR